eukprot:12594425-Ditylum_brightwellii.AAC.1
MQHQDLRGSEMNTSPPSSSQTNGMPQSLQSPQWTMLVAANKKQPGALEEDEEILVRPINVGNTWRWLFTKVYFELLIKIFTEQTKPCQYGCGKPGGGTQL